MLIVLIGYRGSGKSTVGQLVATRLGIEFVDTDALIELRAGQSIREIFTTQGEGAFRDLESSTLEDIVRWQGARVVATGGGIVIRESNRALLQAGSSARYYLKSDAGTLHQRLCADSHNDRPSLTGLPPLAEVERLLAERSGWYEALSTHTIDVTHLGPAQVASIIVGNTNSDALRCFG